MRSVQGLEESGEGEGSTDNFISTDFLGRSSKSPSRDGRGAPGGHGLVAILVGFSLAGVHVVKWRH